MAPTATQRKAAETLKAEGNTLFSKGRFLPAAERYTEAITLVPRDPAFAALYVNRAMCYKKVGDRWQAVVDDAAVALSLDGGLMKAHYLMGIGLRELQQLSDSVTHLTKALEAAREKGDTIKDDIWRELAKTKYAAWQRDSRQRTAAAKALKGHLDGLLQTCQWQPGCMPAEAISSSISNDPAKHSSYLNWHDIVQQQWQELFARAAHLDHPEEVPSHLLCPLTMEVFRDPVITPSGCSYERSALLEHLTRVGKFDPISRSPMTESDAIPNVALRNATQHYLDEHPWAWHECV